MSKEYLDELNRLGAIRKFDGGDNYSLGDKKEFKTVKKALHRLESIDNASPSKALKELDILRHLEIGFDKNGEPITLNDTKGFPIIKNALLKSQEQENKKYLKWEDLKFTAKEQTIKVLLNGEKYFVKYRLGYLFGYYETVEITTKGCVLCTLGNLMIQFFNDLHLEVIDNE